MKKNGRVNREREKEEERETNGLTESGNYILYVITSKWNNQGLKFVLPVKLNKVMNITNIIDFFFRFYTASHRNEKLK